MDEPITLFEKLSNTDLSLLVDFEKSKEYLIIKKLLEDDIEKAKLSAITDSPVTIEGIIDYGYLTRSGQRLNLYFIIKKILEFPNRAREELAKRKKA